MPRSLCPPTYRLHKARNCAVVTIRGRNHYLGPLGSPESLEAYARLIADWQQSRQVPTPVLESRNGDPGAFTISALILAFWQHVTSYYVKPDGTPTSERVCLQMALRRVRKIYGSLPAADFGPKCLKNVRQSMISEALSRGVINKHIGRIKRMFKWAVAEELVPPSVFHGLQAVDGLRYGRSAARETEPIKPVPDAWVDAVLPFVAPQVAAMIDLQRLTGMRPCEVVQMRAMDIDMTGEIWVYEPADHKNRWRGHRRLIPLGPRAMEVVRPFLTADPARYLFSPAEADAWRSLERRKGRRSPMTPSQLRRKRKKNPRRGKRERYDSCSYRHAVVYGIKKARKAGLEVPMWFPLQLRHSRGTEVRRKFGLEGAQVTLGHVHAAVTEVYAEKNLYLAVEIARQMG